MDSSAALKVGIFAGAGYLAYRAGLLSMFGVGSGSVASTNVALPDAGRLDAIFAAMVAKAHAPSEGLSVDDWNSFLMQANPGVSAPDPMPLFQAAIPTFERSQKLTAAQYWPVMAPAIRAQLGLTGLGMFAPMFGRGW